METQSAAIAAPTPRPIPGPIPGDIYAPAKLAQPNESERDYFTVILNCDKAAHSLDALYPEKLSGIGKSLLEGCRALKENRELIAPASLAAYLRKCSDEAEGQSKATAFHRAANFIESDLTAVPLDKRLLQARTAEELAEEINNGGFSPMPQRRAINLLSLPELFRKPDPDFLINQILVAGTVALFTAKEESYKSFLATDMALCVATGKPYHSFKINRPGPVVYVAAEGASGLKRRVQAWMQDRNETVAADRFLVLDEPLQIAAPTERAAFIAHVSEMKPALIIFDTLRRCSVGLDENSAADMGVFTDALGEIAAKTGACVLAIHHNNKTGEYSGSTALAGNVDTRLTCKRHTDGLVTLTIEKQKDFEKHSPISFENRVVAIRDTKGEANSLVFDRVAYRRDDADIMGKNEKRVLEILAQTGEKGLTNAEWQEGAKSAGISESTFKRAIASLSERVQVVSGEKGQRGARYAVAAPVQEAQDERDAETETP
jgi:hypothetical protein